MPIRILIADDHEVVRVGLRSMLQGSDVEVVAEAGSGGQALAAVEQYAASLDLVLLDVRLPDGDGLKILSLSLIHI